MRPVLGGRAAIHVDGLVTEASGNQARGNMPIVMSDRKVSIFPKDLDEIKIILERMDTELISV